MKNILLCALRIYHYVILTVGLWAMPVMPMWKPMLTRAASSQAYTLQAKCQRCTFAAFCPTFREAMRVAKRQPSGNLEISDIAQALASSFGAMINGGALFAILKEESLWDLSAGETVATAMLMAFSATFTWRAISCLKHRNSAWRAANDLRSNLSNSRWAALSTGLWAGATIRDLNDNKYGSAAFDATMAAFSAHSFRESEKDLVITCCEVKKRIARIKQELSMRSGFQD